MYETYYGLSKRAFKLAPDTSFFFDSEGHTNAMTFLRYGLTQGEGFIVVTGQAGTGKTMIARSLMDSLTDDIIAIRIVTSRLSPLDLLGIVASKFGLSVNGKTKAEILQTIEAYLLKLHSQNKRALLIVDEAQNLPIISLEELRMLSNFQVGDQPLAQSFLLGQEGLKKMLELPEMEQFRQRVIASWHLLPLDHEACKSYILHRLVTAGWQNNPRFAENCFLAIAEHTRGNPRKINVFCDRLLLNAYLEGATDIDIAMVHEIIAEFGKELSGSLQASHEKNSLSHSVPLMRAIQLKVTILKLRLKQGLTHVLGACSGLLSGSKESLARQLASWSNKLQK